MPNERNIQNVYIDTGDPDTWNAATLFREGELGAAFEWNDRSYQVVRCDTGATASTSSGVVAANDAAYWKDKDLYLVTNDAVQALGGQAANNAYRNFVAGVFRVAVTAGNYCAVLQRADNVNVADGGNTFVAGEHLVAEADTAASAFDRVAAGTAPGSQRLGTVRGAAAAGVAPVDLDIPSIP